MRHLNLRVKLKPETVELLNAIVPPLSVLFVVAAVVVAAVWLATQLAVVWEVVK